MPAGLRRYYGKGHLHFITFSCYRRLALLKTARTRDIFVKELGKVRDEMGFHLLGYDSGLTKTYVRAATMFPKRYGKCY
jgi:REP-associated tyrosine transposase